MGPLILDLNGCELDQEEQDIVQHPTVGGIILFARNYDNPKQIQDLVRQIREYAGHEVLIAVDQEGGRVQRFRQGFSSIMAMGEIFSRANNDLNKAQKLAKEMGWLMASEVASVGVDVSFAPVLDINAVSAVVGDRSFNPDPQLIVPLASSFIAGMNEAGMVATGKHFPGHGSVKEDSHVAIPVDERDFAEISQLDMAIFSQLIKQQRLAGIMPAHVVYPAVDALAAGFSAVWLKQILRQQLGFDGVIFSDDLTMKGAAVLGSFSDRAQQALAAGCDVVLACNDRRGAVEILDNLPITTNIALIEKRKGLKAQPKTTFSQLQHNPRWQACQRWLD